VLKRGVGLRANEAVNRAFAVFLFELGEFFRLRTGFDALGRTPSRGGCGCFPGFLTQLITSVD